MIDPTTLALFTLACLALNLTPGPDMLLVATRAAGQGRLAGFATYFGIAAGAYVHGLALALGLSQLFVAVPLAYDLVRYAGAAYLLFLAWQAFRAPPVLARPAGLRRHRIRTMLMQGFLTNVLNPKVALFFLALFPQFLNPEAGSIGLQVLILVTVLNTTGLLVNGAVVLIAARAGTAMAGRGALVRWGNALTGAIFAGLALRLLWPEHKG